MSIPFAWPIFTTRRPPKKAFILLDTTCFTSDFEDFASQNHSLPWTFKPSDPTNMPNPEVAEMLRKKEINPRYIHPTFPPATFLTTLIQQDRFEEYIANEFPSLNLLLESTTNHEPLQRKEVNATTANSLFKVTSVTFQAGATEWVCKALFPDKFLPVPFNDACLDDIPECWDKSRHQFSNLPETMGEQDIQNWLNHLAHTLGVQHGLIEEKEPEEILSACDDEDAGVDRVDSGTEKKGFVIANAEDRSFSNVSHNKAPSGGHRLRKPDIVLINRNLRHFLKDNNYRPRWHQVEAIVEVSASASRNSMLRQILEKAALMFESQPFRRFAIGLVLRGIPSKNTAEFSFTLVDRAGSCRTDWVPISGYDALNLARIVFALSYAKPKFLGIDTSMTVDLSGNVTKIKVKDQEFNVIKHIYSSLILFGRGTHVFLVQDKDGKSHILKDAWLLADHGISEIDILSTISDALKNDPSINAQKYQSMHPRFVVGEEMEDSTNTHRGRLANTPPERLHRRVVTGPVGDPLTSFRSREEFVQVLLDCVDCKSSIQYQSYLFNCFSGLEFLHTKCNIVHGDLSINNIVIYRTPLSCPPQNTLPRKVSARKTTAKTQATFTSAPTEGLTETIPVTGVVIDYDYARNIGTTTEKTSVRLHHFLDCSILKFMTFCFRAPCLSCLLPLWTKKITANISTVLLMTSSHFSTQSLGLSPSLQDRVAKSVRPPTMFLLHDGTMRLILSSYTRIKLSICLATKGRFTNTSKITGSLSLLTFVVSSSLHGPN
jgi:hypothetical protein